MDSVIKGATRGDRSECDGEGRLYPSGGQVKSDCGLRLCLFGPPRILLGNEPLQFSRRKTAALLIYLAVTGRTHPRQLLATLLWGDLPQNRAANGLGKSLCELREQVGDHLQITRQTVALTLDCPIWVDSAAFEAGVVNGLAERTPEHLQAAIDLYRDDFLSGFELSDAADFEEWALLQREHLNLLLLRGLQRLAEEHSRRGATALAITCVTRLLALDPWREEAHRLLMRLLARTGQRGAALAQYRACRHALAADLGSEPLPETTALYEQLCREPVERPHDLPVPATRLVGRRAELALLQERLADPDCRLISVVGLGGTGKSHLALVAARAYVEAITSAGELIGPDEVRLISLPDDTRADDVSAAIAVALGVAPARALAAALALRAPLLILDNLPPGQESADLMAALLQHAPRVRLLVTARRRLGLEGEWTLPLGGLELPDSPAGVERSEAGELFLLRARDMVLPATLSPADRSHAARICALVGGHPLALILAADWLRGLSMAALADALTERADLLVAPQPRDADRHGSMRAVLAASIALVSAPTRATLQRLTALADGFGLAAAVSVASVDPAELLALGEVGLILGDGSGRYALPPLIRRIAAEGLRADPASATEAAMRQSAFYADAAWRLSVPGQAGGLALAGELANLRLAWDWALAHGDGSSLAQLCDGLLLAYEGAGDIAGAAAVFDHAARELSGRLAADAANPALSQLHDRLVGIAVDLQLRAARPPREVSSGQHLVAAGARAWRMSDIATTRIADEATSDHLLIGVTKHELVGEDGHPSRGTAARPAWQKVLPGVYATVGYGEPGEDSRTLPLG